MVPTDQKRMPAKTITTNMTKYQLPAVVIVVVEVVITRHALEAT